MSSLRQSTIDECCDYWRKFCRIVAVPLASIEEVNNRAGWIEKDETRDPVDWQMQSAGLLLKFIQIEPNYASFAYFFMRKQSFFYRIAECGTAWTLRKHGHENAALVVLLGRPGLLHDEFSEIRGTVARVNQLYVTETPGFRSARSTAMFGSNVLQWHRRR